MDVKYIPSDWEKMKDGIGDLIGLGRWGKGMIDELKDLSDILEDAESDIAKYDVDGAITFQHSSLKSKYQGLFEDFDVLHHFSGKVGDIVDRTIDQPFYEDMDAFVAAMRDLSISNYTTTNRIGATEIVQSYAGYGVPQQFEIDKAEVSLDDLFSGDHFYGEQMKLEYEEWKNLNPDQDFSQKEYQQAIVNTRAFEYESIRNTQENKEFWFQIGALAVIVGASLIFPPAGIALGAAYGAYELTSAVSGKELISGRELDTSERWVRGLLAPLDIVPGAGVAVTKFAGAGATGLVRIGGKIVPTSLKTGVNAGIQKGVTSVKNLAETASHFGAVRLKSAGTVIQNRANMVINKVEKDIIEAALGTAKLADKVHTGMKDFGNMFAGKELAADGVGALGRFQDVNTHVVENKVKDIVSKFEVNISDGITKGTGNKTLEVKFTKEQLATKPLYSPVPEKWIKKGGTVKIDEDGTWVYINKKEQTVRYPDGYPDFTEYSHPTVKSVEIEIASPTNRPLDYKNANIKAGLNKDSDPPVASLNEAPEGYTWHHHQDGKTMLLVDKKVHREFTHSGGVSIINGK